MLDASVGVKWFAARGEDGLKQAMDIRARSLPGDVQIVVPDLFYYEVSNALVHKKSIPVQEVALAMGDLFSLGLQDALCGPELMVRSVNLARELNITVYDACYAAVAIKHSCPLVTANPKYQGRALGCQVIPLDDWR